LANAVHRRRRSVRQHPRARAGAHGHGHCPRQGRRHESVQAKLPLPFRRDPASRGEHASTPGDEAAPKPAREPDDEHAPGESAEAGWRASSYDLQRGLDVVELPTSLPADVLDRLFNAPRR